MFVRVSFRGRSPIQAYVCYYSAYAHRAKFKAWTRTELVSHVGQPEKRGKFLSIEQNIISQRKAGAVAMDMSLIPMPNVEVVSTRDQAVEVRATEEKIVTEAAFKRRAAPLLVPIVRPVQRIEGYDVLKGILVVRISSTLAFACQSVD